MDKLLEQSNISFYTQYEHLSEIQYTGWNAVVDLNLSGTFMCTREGILD